jgi:hypothetical protein
LLRDFCILTGRGDARPLAAGILSAHLSLLARLPDAIRRCGR